MTPTPTQREAEIQAARAEGRVAAEAGKSFRSDCPYTFDHAGVSQTEFNERVRHKLDAWFDGWKGWLDEHGLGFDFKPKYGNGIALALRQRKGE